MPFWKQKPDPELDAAIAVAEASMPHGWTIYKVDPERYWVPAGSLLTYGVSAVGPSDEAALVIAVGKVSAYREFARYMRGELQKADGWAVPLDRVEHDNRGAGSVSWNEEDPAVASSRQAALDALPSGWDVFYSDREKYRFPTTYLEVYAISAGGPGGEGELVLGLGEAGAYEQLARRLRGELSTERAWAPPLDKLVHR